MNTLCGKKVLQGKDADDATNAHLEEPVKIEPVTVGTFAKHIHRDLECLLISATELELNEEGTRISLTIVDTPGFGDQIDNEAGYDPSCKRTTLKVLLTYFAQLRRDRWLP